MNAPMRRIAMVAIALFALLIGNLTWVQFFQNDFYANHSRNNRVLLQEYSNQRGAILAGSDAIATSVATEGELKYQREYTDSTLWSNLTGYQSLTYGTAGIESFENDVLSGQDDRLFVNRITDLFTGKEQSGGNVILTVDPAVQKKMAEQIDGKKGAAVAFDPKTGAILGQYTSPGYDANPLASHDYDVQQDAWTSYTGDEANPMLDHSANEVYPPGSTFKIIVSAVALSNGFSPDSQVPAGNSYDPPNTDQQIRNSNDQCPSSTMTLTDAFKQSCNTTFARMCVENDWGDDIAAMAEAFGIGSAYSTPVGVLASTAGSGLTEDAFLAQSCIGQYEVALTTFQNALVAATVANGGSRMQPYLVKELQAPDQTTLERTTATEMNDAVSSDVAAGLQTLMQAVVAEGTGTSAQIPGVTVGGKTGTAEHGDLPEHGWFTGYAMGDDGQPAVAVCVFLDSAGDGGSSEATRIAGEVMKTALGK